MWCVRKCVLLAYIAINLVLIGEGRKSPQHQLQKRSFTPKIDFNKVTKIWGPDISVNFTFVILMQNLFAIIGWLISGVLYSGMSEDSSKGTFSYLFGPQAVAINSFRCLIVFVTMFLGLALKTLFTLGMYDTMGKYMSRRPNDIMKFLTGDAFLLEIIGRGIFTAVFQLLGWVVIGKIAGTKVFVSQQVAANNGKKRKRRRRRSLVTNPIMDPFRAREEYFKLVPMSSNFHL